MEGWFPQEEHGPTASGDQSRRVVTESPKPSCYRCVVQLRIPNHNSSSPGHTQPVHKSHDTREGDNTNSAAVLHLPLQLVVRGHPVPNVVGVPAALDRLQQVVGEPVRGLQHLLHLLPPAEVVGQAPQGHAGHVGVAGLGSGFEVRLLQLALVVLRPDLPQISHTCVQELSNSKRNSLVIIVLPPRRD